MEGDAHGKVRRCVLGRLRSRWHEGKGRKDGSELCSYGFACCSPSCGQGMEASSAGLDRRIGEVLLGNADEAATRCLYSKCLAVVVFSECSKNWNYTIRMPSEMVANTSLIIAAAPSSEADPILFGGLNAYKPSRVASYLVHGFVSLQAAMNRQILSLADPTASW